MTTTVNDDYSPSFIVRQSHNILHLNGKFESVSNEFALTYDSQWNDYTRSLLTIPIICGILGINAVVWFQLALCCRIYFKRCRCLPIIQESERGDTKEVVKCNRLSRQHVVCLMLSAFAVIVIFTNQMVLFGNHYLTEGVDSSREGINFLHDLTTTLTDQGNSLISTGDLLENDLNAAAPTCPPASSLASGVSTYFDQYVDDYLGYVDHVPGRCDDANDGLDTWEYYKNDSLWVIYAFVWIIVGLYTIGILLKQRWLLQISLGFTLLFVTILFVIIAVLMTIVIGFGDFCMDPLTYTGGLLPRDIYNVTSYYLDCQGVNPLNADLNDAYEFVAQYTYTINGLLATSCTGNTGLQTSLTDLVTINSTLNAITASIVCPPIQSQLSHVIQTGLCTEGFEGFYTIWLGIYITVCCLLVTAIFVSFIYQFFDLRVNSEKEDDEIVISENPIVVNIELTQQVKNEETDSNEFSSNTNVLHEDNPHITA